MKRLVKIMFNVSYVISLSALVSLLGAVSGVANKGNHDKDGRTILGSDLSINFASADVPTGGAYDDGDEGDGGDF